VGCGVSAAMRRGVSCGMSAAMRSAVGHGVSAAVGNGTGMILRIATAGDIAASAGSGEAMAAPAVAVAPVGPGTYAEEDAVIEVARTVVPVGCTGVRSVVIVAPLADGRTTNVNANLRAAYGNPDPDLRAGRCRRDCQAG
jgi:hypothetical protein